ncbi:MAG: hypothetical protein QOJ91_1288, partial [Sphingomonadales bacterium]|nr:hypothetical protein [Sphingomonadales bacterium]
MSGGHGDLLIGADPAWRTHPV